MGQLQKAVRRPIPSLLGDSRSVDLLGLFWVVRENGGFDLVSKKGLWGFVAEELGNISFVKNSISCDDDEKGDHDNDNGGDGNEVFLCKRKRESFSGMLSSLRQISTNPCDLTIGKAPEAPKWKEQALKVHEALLQKGKICSNTHQSPLQNQVTPKGIDSDDDELEFGSLSEGFGKEAVKVSVVLAWYHPRPVGIMVGEDARGTNLARAKEYIAADGRIKF
ncbi:ARID DNA-binding domain, partial [Dillenia turbinata]